MSPRKNVNAIVIICVVTLSIALKRLPFGKYERSSNFTETAMSNHYATEEHIVTTNDGYLLTLFRMTKAGKCHDKTKRRPVLLMHGLLQNSDVFLHAGPSAGLAYLLSDECHDVWIGNQRGNNYARKHLKLNPDKDAEFWKFSTDEIGYYDVTATIDYILEHTASDKLNYIGFSQGGGTFFIMCSERAGYCDKAAVMIALAPAVLLESDESITLSITFALITRFKKIFEMLGTYEVCTEGSFFQALLETYCEVTGQWPGVLCETGAFLDGYHPGSKTGDSQRLFLKHLTMGTSLDTMVRYGQHVGTGRFQKLDFGAEINLIRYNNTQAPKYDLDAVSAPVVLIQGKNDKMVSILDVKKLATKLPNIIEMFEVTDPLWTHMDMIYSQDIKTMIYPTISIIYGYIPKVITEIKNILTKCVNFFCGSEYFCSGPNNFLVWLKIVKLATDLIWNYGNCQQETFINKVRLIRPQRNYLYHFGFDRVHASLGLYEKWRYRFIIRTFTLYL